MIVDMQPVGSLSSNDVPCVSNACPRLLRRFHVIGVPSSDDLCLGKLFSYVIGSAVSVNPKTFAKTFEAVLPKLVSATLSVYKFASSKFLATPQKPHYSINPRDVMRLAEVINISFNLI